MLGSQAATGLTVFPLAPLCLGSDVTPSGQLRLQEKLRRQLVRRPENPARFSRRKVGHAGVHGRRESRCLEELGAGKNPLQLCVVLACQGCEPCRAGEGSTPGSPHSEGPALRVSKV